MISRRILAAVALLCVLGSPAYAQKTKATLNTEIGVNFPDNSTGFITPSLLRATTADIVNSIMPTAPVVSGNLACFNGTTGLLQDCGTVPIPAIACGASTWVSSLSAGVLHCTQPAFTDISGTVAAAQIPNPTASTLGGVESKVVVTHQFLNTISTSGVPGSAQPACADLSTAGPGCSAAAGQLPGTATNDSATAGNVGEYIESIVLSGSAVSFGTATAKTVTSISLTAGDWDVDGYIYYITASTTSVTSVQGYLSLSTNAVDTTPGRFNLNFFPASVPTAATPTMTVPLVPYRFSLSGTTSIFLVSNQVFTAAALTGYGIIRARRVR